MKKIIFTILMIALSNGFVFAQNEPIDTDGDGYRNISTLDELRWVSENDSSWSWKFELDNNINAADTKNWNGNLGFSPIGIDYKTKFSGEFEGNGYEIDSIYINRTSQSNVAIFGYIGGAEIRNVGMVNCNITGKEQVGGLVGNNNGSTVINCYSTGKVEGDYNVGGLVGANDASTVIRCYSTSRVEGDYNIGGLVGYNEISKVSTSYSTGYVTGSDEVGGLAGENNYSTVINCYSISSVYGTKQVGGFVGNCNYSTVINCYSTGYVSGIEYIGGLVGYNFESNVTRSFWDTQTRNKLLPTAE